MNHQQIKKIIDRTKFENLSKVDLAEIERHVAGCQNCERAFQAARIYSVLLNAQTAVEMFEPSPFFQAKVLNAWREKQLIQKPLAAFYRWWQASAALVFLMMMSVAGLITLTVFAPNSNAGEAQVGMPDFNLYPTDAVILNQKPSQNLTRGQILEVLDETGDNPSKRK